MFNLLHKAYSRKNEIELKPLDFSGPTQDSEILEIGSFETEPSRLFQRKRKLSGINLRK